MGGYLQMVGYWISSLWDDLDPGKCKIIFSRMSEIP